ncbi:uncharacterized protein LOC119912696 [Micropterus salmoides]|uniref:uncharacterized protein LOC119912696 n=1 Tax=Micropterus salmoides TaxID=27706 RepID=UPI0018ECF4E2|nr:uncharacterized protein LOC119912696 [Micropterus salmoides]
MAALTFVVLFSFSWIFVLAKKETQEVKVKPGEDATLECLVAPTMDTTGWVYWVHWDRLGQKDNFVFVRYGNISYVEEMLPRYRGAVEMKDPELKDGDATVILRNVDISDAGTYECRVLLLPMVTCGRFKPNLISTIRLTVTERGHTAGHKEGGDKEGGDKKGGDKEGVNTDGGDKKGGDKKGGDKEPVNTHGGDQKGGNKEEGDKQGGDQEGGDKEGGDKEGVNTDGGDKKGGNKEEGDKQGGDQEGETRKEETRRE